MPALRHWSPRAAPPSDPIVDLKRALFLAVDALEQRTRLAVRRQGTLPRNAGKPWTAD